jgi:hypothetical protein
MKYKLTEEAKQMPETDKVQEIIHTVNKYLDKEILCERASSLLSKFARFPGIAFEKSVYYIFKSNSFRLENF